MRKAPLRKATPFLSETKRSRRNTNALSIGTEPLLTPAEACAFLRIGRTTLHKITRNGELAVVVICGCKRYSLDALRAFASAHQHGGVV